MEKVKLLNGIFKISQEKGKEYLMYLDADRLLAPCYEAIGQEPKKTRYGGWEEKEISGHSLGHFLSALSAMYVADGDPILKEKIDYIVSELSYLQSLDDEDYVSGFPRICFDKVFSGDFNVTRFELGDSWVPWYSIHKIYAGLIDAYELTGNEEALKVVIKLSNWAKRGTDKLNDEQFEKMVFCEHGGMCESMAKLYKITNNKDYLDLAIRFAHKETLKPLIELNDELEGKHANTQIPKVIGAATIYEITGNEDYKKASKFFWDIVTQSRSYVIGGNSRDEHFGKIGTEALGVTTAETCNTYNMLKLTEHLYQWEHKAEYMDYYENALYNHILASQDPESGMKTYFVSTQPGHFKVYSSPENAFWCCTGTGMENPARYIRSIYYKENDDLYVNLFISSKIILEDINMVISQKTSFPQSEISQLIIEKADNKFMKINIRVPYWVADDIKVCINGIEEYSQNEVGYISISRYWNEGDIITISLPMQINKYVSRDSKNKVAFMYGPIVLAGALGKENFPKADILDDHLKLNHYPGIIVPSLVTDKEDILKCINKVEDEPLIFKINGIGQPGNIDIKLIPFYNIHHERYTIYWKLMNLDQYRSSDLTSDDYQERIDMITIDEVNPNEQQSEIEHKLESCNSKADYSTECGKGWRECIKEGYFSYEMNINEKEDLYLIVTYWGSDRELFVDGVLLERNFNIYVDNTLICTEKLKEEKAYSLFDKVYPLSNEIIKNKSKIRVKFESDNHSIAGRVFGIRIINEKI